MGKVVFLNIEVLLAKTNTFMYIIGIALIILVVIFISLWLISYRKSKLIKNDLKKQNRDIEEKEFQYNIAMKRNNSFIARYDIKTKTLCLSDEYAKLFNTKTIHTNMPDSVINEGYVSEKSISDYKGFYKKIHDGEKSGKCILEMKLFEGKYASYEEYFETMFDEDGSPSIAIISYEDVTQRIEVQLAYERWKERFVTISPEMLVVFEFNITQDTGHYVEGKLIPENIPITTFDDTTRKFVLKYVHPSDSDEFNKFMNREKLIVFLEKRELNHTFVFRLIRGKNDFIWTRLSIQLISEPISRDIYAHIVFQDIDAEKKNEILLKNRAEIDSLTNIYNRITFIEKVEETIKAGNSKSSHALLYFDIDGFKIVNDVLGHEKGDMVLRDTARTVSNLIREGDLFGRLGGDEFVILLKNIPYRAVIDKKANLICSELRKVMAKGITLSSSIGIAIYPSDGTNFDTLYRAADIALAHAKKYGKDRYCFYKDNMEEFDIVKKPVIYHKYRILIICDNNDQIHHYHTILGVNYILFCATGIIEGLKILKRFGHNITAIVIDTNSNNITNTNNNSIERLFSIIDENKELESIPIIGVIDSISNDLQMKYLKMGVTELITRPIDEELLLFKLSSIIIKAENDLFRLQNSYSLLQNEEEERYKHIIESAKIIVVEYDYINKFFKYDPNIYKIIKGDFEDAQSVWEILERDNLTTKEHIKRMRNFIIKIINDKELYSSNMRVELKTVDDEIHWFNFNVIKITNNYNQIRKLLITLSDVDEEVKIEQKLHERAETDLLTGLYNRISFIEKVAEKIKTVSPNEYLMIVFDIDRFKLINEDYGYDAGNRFLRFFADVIKEITDDDSLLCHLFSDNFVICVKNEDRYLNGSFYNECLNKIKDYHFPFEVTACFGVYIIDDTSLQIETMIDHASLAHKSIKGVYGECYAVYDETLKKREKQEENIVSTMNSSLSNREFVVYFQPQFNHATKELVGAEALVRWMHPERGLIPPSEFIPIFEKNGFILKLDNYVWEETARIVRGWLDRNIEPVPVSINVSRANINNFDLCKTITEIADKYELPHDLLRIEITESAYSHNSKQMIENVRMLKNNGFVVEMDDFGSGYSSLNTLKEIPVDIIKLDLRFLSDDNGSNKGGNILNSIVRMARWLNLGIIAEGVETVEQADYLKSIGCNIVQGYLYERPIPEEDFIKVMLNSKMGIMVMNNRLFEKMDANDFWNPESLQTLVFNSYVGGAAIIEYKTNEFIEVLRVNDKFMDTLKIPDEKSSEVQKDFYSVLSVASRKTVVKAIEETIATGVESECETLRHEYFTNKPIWIRSSFQLLTSNGDYHILYVSVQNITARKTAEEKTNRTVQRLNMVVNSIPSGILVMRFSNTNEYQELLFITDGFCNLVGYKKEEFLRLKNEKFLFNMFEDDKKNYLLEYDNTVTTHNDYCITYRIVHGISGKIVWVSERGCWTKDNESNILYISCTDITEQMVAQHNLESQLEKRQVLVSCLSTLSKYNNDDFDEIINTLLNTIGDYYMSKHIIYLSESHEILFEKTLDGIKPCFEELFKSYSKEWKTLLKNIYKEDYLLLKDFSKVKSFNKDIPLRDALDKKGIEKIIFLPIKDKKSIAGILGIVEPLRNESDISLVITLSYYLSMEILKNEETKEKQKTKKDLFETAKILNTIMSTIPGGICLYKHSKDVITPIMVNKYLCDMLGVSINKAYEMLSEDYFNFIHPDDVDMVKGLVSDAIANLKPFTACYRLVNVRTKKDIWISLTAVVTKNKDDSCFIYAAYSDISELRQIQDKLDSTNKRLSTIMDNAPGGMCLYRYKNEKLTLEYYNNGYASLVGDTNDKIDANTFAKAVHPDDIATYYDIQSKTLTELESQYHIYRVYNKKYCYIGMNAIPIKEKDDSIFIYVTYSDIDDLVDAQKKLQINEKLINRALEYCQIDFWEYDVQNDISNMSVNSRKMFGFPEKLKDFSRNVYNYLNVEEESRKVLEAFLTKAKDLKPSAEDDILVNIKKEKHWLRLKYTLNFDEKDNLYKAFCTIVDVTERKEQERLYNEKISVFIKLTQNSIGIYKLNLTNNSYDEILNKYLHPKTSHTVDALINSFLERTKDKAEKNQFLESLSRQEMIDAHNRGKYSLSLLSRFTISDDKEIWISTYAYLTSNPLNGNIEAMLTINDFNDQMTTRHTLDLALQREYDYIGYIDARVDKCSLVFSSELNNKNIIPSELSFSEAIKNYLADNFVDDLEVLIEELTIKKIESELKERKEYFVYFTCNQKDSIVKKRIRFSYINADTHCILFTISKV